MADVIRGIRSLFAVPGGRRSRSGRASVDMVADTPAPSMSPLFSFNAAPSVKDYWSPEPVYYPDLDDGIERMVTPDPADAYGPAGRVDVRWEANSTGGVRYVGVKGMGIIEVDEDEVLDDEVQQALLRTRLKSDNGSDEFRETSPVDPNHVPPAPRVKSLAFIPPPDSPYSEDEHMPVTPGYRSSDVKDYGAEGYYSCFQASQSNYDYYRPSFGNVASRLVAFGEYAIPGDDNSTNADRTHFEQPQLHVPSISAQNPLDPPLPNITRVPFSPSNTMRVPEPQAFKPAMEEPSEMALVNSNLAVLEEAIVGVGGLFSSFSQSPLLADHVKMCRQIVQELTRVKVALERRKQLSPGQWGSRSARWQEKHVQRLLSLQRTLERLRGIKRLIDSRTRPPRRDQLKKLLEKLGQHQRKLADLAAKFDAAFDRLIAKNLHSMLSTAHANAAQLRDDHANERDRFKNKWSQNKAVRAHLRQQFFKYSSRN